MKNELMHYEDIRHEQSTKIINTINTLPISHEWKKIFSKVCTERTWYHLNKTQQSQMINIAEANSNAVKYLMAEHKKKSGLRLMEKISVELPTEEYRHKAMMAILDKGAKEAKRDIDLLIAKAKQA